MKFLSDDILVLVIEKENEPIAVIQHDMIDVKDNMSVHCLYNNELARKNIEQYLSEYSIQK